MTMYEPNPRLQPTGEEAGEYVEDPTGDPPPPASADPTGEARPEADETGND